MHVYEVMLHGENHKLLKNTTMDIRQDDKEFNSPLKDVAVFLTCEAETRERSQDLTHFRSLRLH